MLGLNTRRGDVAAGENGLSALPDRQTDARAAIDKAVSCATRINAANIHVMAGFARGDNALDTFVGNLRHACAAAAAQGITILIEPLNRHDAPGYFLQTTDQAAAIMDQVAAPNLRLMFDCDHVQRNEGDVTTRLRALLPQAGHIQVASAPDRGTPDHGELNYTHVFATVQELGWDAPLGVEYKSSRPTDNTLGWMSAFRRAAA